VRRELREREAGAMEKIEEQGCALRLEQEHAGELARLTSRAGGSSGRTRQRKLGGRESCLEGGELAKTEIYNFKHNYKLGLALEINSSPKERGKQINQENKASDTVICFTEVRFLQT
jgi:hypothetical protein